MLSKRHRIYTQEFSLILKGKRRAYGPFFVSFFEKKEETVCPKVAVVCSKKIAKTSVLRNAIRREIYQIARPFVLKSQKPILCAFFLNKGYSELTHEERNILISKAFFEIGF